MSVFTVKNIRMESFGYTWGPLSQKSWAGTDHMGNRPCFRWPSIMLMSSSKASSKSPFPEMRQKTLAPKHNLSIRQIVHHKGRGMRVRESGNSAGADDFVFGSTERNHFFPVLISGRIFYPGAFCQKNWLEFWLYRRTCFWMHPYYTGINTHL